MANILAPEKKPTVNGNDLYQLGNDYPQTEGYYATSSYADGLYTELKVDVSSMSGYNKRILNVSGASSVFDPIYATAEVKDFSLNAEEA